MSSPRRVKICDLTQFYSPVSGGVRRYIEQKRAHLRAYHPEWEHILIVPGAATEVIGDTSARTYTIASPLISRTSRYRALTKLHLIEEALEKERPHIIESGDPYQVAWKAVASGRGLEIPVVGFYHSHFSEAYIRTIAKYFGPMAVSITDEACRRYVKALYNRFERTFVPSPTLARVLRDWGLERVEAVDLGVDTEVFNPMRNGREEKRRELGIPSHARLLLYVGRLAPEKNVQTLFNAFSIFHATAPGKYHLLCVGDGTQRATLLEWQRTMNTIHWMPYCSDVHELAALYRAADLFVHPGVHETFGLVALESQASGTCVVGIRGSYMDRIIFSDQQHWAIENTPEALAAAIEANFNRDLVTAGRSASKEALARYSWRTVFQAIVGAYSKIISDYNA